MKVQTVRKKKRKWKGKRRKKKIKRPDVCNFGYDTTPINPKLAGDHYEYH